MIAHPAFRPTGPLLYRPSVRPAFRPLIPRPVKHVGYPWKVKEKWMTIAMGMLCDSGVVLCADSLVTTGTLGSFESKLLAYRLDNDTDVAFAWAGNVDLAESAVLQCQDVVTVSHFICKFRIARFEGEFSVVPVEVIRDNAQESVRLGKRRNIQALR